MSASFLLLLLVCIQARAEPAVAPGAPAALHQAAARTAAQAAPPPTPLAAAPAVLGRDEARGSEQRAIAWLLTAQRADGAWGTAAIDSLQMLWGTSELHYTFQVAANALACRALAGAVETPERRTALERGLTWLCTTRLPRRGSEWDVDCNWSAIYGFDACVTLARDPRFAAEPWRALLERRGREFYALLERHQDPSGGWGYYEGPVVSRRPTWATSFSTAAVLPALVSARDGLAWGVDPALVERALRYVRRCALPSGAYEYDLKPIPRVSGGENISDVKGSLGRIQVCNLARRVAGDRTLTDDVLRAGLERFLGDHRFLDVARLKPVPHESWYQNAAYFYNFGHCYAALAVNQLPPAEREGWHARLRPHLSKVQFADGSTYDFIGNSWAAVSGTAFLALGLQAGLAP